MTENARNQSLYATPDERRIRCLKIAEHVYWSGSASVEELSATLAELAGVTDSTAGSVEEDIGLLSTQGLPICIGEGGNWRIEAVIPGFALRLTKAQASAVWGMCVASGELGEGLGQGASSATLSEGVATLLSGLKRFHKGSEVMTAVVSATSGVECPYRGEREEKLRASKLIGEARLVYRRLRIVDLVEGRTARNTEQLAAGLNVSHRTIHDDLSVLRCAGFEIGYSRRRQEYRAAGLNEYLGDKLSVSTAAALLVLWGASDASDAATRPPCAFEVASQKLSRSIRRLFAGQAEDLEKMAASYRVAEQAK